MIERLPALKSKYLYSPESSTMIEGQAFSDLPRFIYGLGNNENKALLFIAMAENNPDHVFFKKDLSELFLTIQGGNIIWPVSASGLHRYCEKSLYPAGFVGLIPNGSEKENSGFILLNNDIGLAESFAGHMLDFSLNYTPSLQDLWEATREWRIDGLTEASTIRRRIFETLPTLDLPARAIDVARKIDRPLTAVGKHLRHLDNTVLSYESTPRGEPVVFHRLSVKALKHPQLPHKDIKLNRRTLSNLVYDIIYQNEFQGNADWLTTEQTADIIIENNKHFRENVSRQSLTTQIKAIYAHFKRAGLVETLQFEERKFSDVDISSEQRKTLSDLLDILHKFQTRDPKFIEDGITKAREIINDEKKVQVLVEKSKSASNHYLLS
jgi:hypothetical protein